MPYFKYRANRLHPHERTDAPGEVIVDAVSGAVFPKAFAVEGPYGLVDSRDGGAYDLDGDAHEMQVTMLGHIPDKVVPNGT